MKLGIMQPYFFPYIGYWQLLNAVDQYILAEDVNYIKGGYINRNSILINGESQYFRIPVLKQSQNRNINEHELGFTEAEIDKMLLTIRSAYAKAPNFERVYAHIKDVLDYGLTEEGKNLASFLAHAIKSTAKMLGIDTPIMSTSDLLSNTPFHETYSKEYYVVAICKALNADEYYNAIGGTKLYYQKFFRDNGINLKFVKTDSDISYEQFGHEFVPNLSIIDVMMFCSQEQIKELLNSYTLVDGYESPEDVGEE